MTTLRKPVTAQLSCTVRYSVDRSLESRFVLYPDAGAKGYVMRKVFVPRTSISPLIAVVIDENDEVGEAFTVHVKRGSGLRGVLVEVERWNLVRPEPRR